MAVCGQVSFFPYCIRGRKTFCSLIGFHQNFCQTALSKEFGRFGEVVKILRKRFPHQLLLIGILCIRTETIDNTLNPHWAKKIILDFQFERRQMIRIQVYDSDR